MSLRGPELRVEFCGDNRSWNVGAAGGLRPLPAAADLSSILTVESLISTTSPSLPRTFVLPISQTERTPRHQAPLPNTQRGSGRAWIQAVRFWILPPNHGTPLLLGAEIRSPGSVTPLGCPWVGFREIHRPPEFACKAPCIFLGKDPECFRGARGLMKVMTLCTRHFPEEDAESHAVAMATQQVR